MTEERHGEQIQIEDAVLDIGGDMGALILYTDASYRGQEIEVSLIGDESVRVHTAIHERRMRDRVVFAGVFPELRAGIYRIWGDEPAAVERVTIVGGEVAEVDLRQPPG